MIQEIYNYLYTKSLLLEKEVLLVDDGNEEKNLSDNLLSILNVLTLEPYFADREDTRKMLSSFIQKYRFSFPNNTKIKVSFNELIKVINEHQAQDKKTTNKEKKQWLESEYKDRCLPKKFRNEKTMIEFVRADAELFMNMSGFYCFDGVNFEPVPKLLFNNLDVVEYLGLMNLMINREPRYFSTKERIDLLMEHCYSFSKGEKNVTVLNYIKRTIRNLKRIDRERRIVIKQVIKEEKRKLLELAK